MKHVLFEKRNTVSAIQRNCQYKHTMQSIAFKDNRPSFAVQKKTIQLLNHHDDRVVRNWLYMYAYDYLSDVSPQLITRAANNTIRLRWFHLGLEGRLYTVGVNIHNHGVWGGLWIFPNDTPGDVLNFHPHANPTHGLSQELLNYLIYEVLSQDDRHYIGC